MRHPFDEKRSRPYMPGYGLEGQTDEGMLSWTWVSEQMEKSRSYWLGTTRPDGRPHVAPIWGVWMNDQLWFGTDEKSRKAKNFRQNPNIVVHLESGDDVVIMEGVIKDVDDPAGLRRALEIYLGKYTMPEAPTVEEFAESGAWFNIGYKRVLAWLENDYLKTAARWQFDS